MVRADLSEILPKEHGATVMFATSLVAGFAIGERWNVAVAGMTLLLVGAFFLRTPLLSILRRWPPSAESRAPSILALAIPATISGVGAALLAPQVEPSSLAILLVPGMLLYGGVVAASARRIEWQLWADVAGAAAGTFPLLAMILAANGELDRRALGPSLAAAIFFLGGTLHLRAILRNGPRFRDPRRVDLGSAALWSVGSAALSLAAGTSGIVPMWAGLSGVIAIFRPVLLRGRVLDRIPRVGLVEAAFTLLFAMGLVFGSRG